MLVFSLSHVRGYGKWGQRNSIGSLNEMSPTFRKRERVEESTLRC